MRIISLLVLILGIVFAVIYPWMTENFAGDEVGSWRVYDRGGSFQPVEVTLSDRDAPVRVIVDLRAIGQFYPSGSETALTVTASTDGRTVLAEELSFIHTSPREDSPQTADLVYRDSPGLIEPASEAVYTFMVGEGDAATLEINSVDLILRRNALRFDRQLQTIGFVLMGVGFASLFFSLFRRRKSKPVNPSGTKWGRG